MSRTLWQTLKLSPAVLSAVIIAANGAVAAENSAKPLLKDNTAVTDLPVGTSPTQSNSELAALPSSDVSSNSPNKEQVAQNTEPGNQPAANSTLDQIDQYSQEPVPAVQSSQGTQETQSLDQVTSVSQLRDVDPTSWAFQALQSLVERYGCIEGYPDRTFRGNRAMTRYEFAAGLNSCLDRIQELIASLPGGISREDLDRLRRLQEEFAVELANLRGRVDSLEARVTEVEANQFSTTTKLRGEVIFGVASVFGDDKAVPSNTPQTYRGLEDNPILGYRARLNFDSSFTGKDLLRVRLQARNITQFDGPITGTSMTRLSYDGNSNNSVELDDLYYRFPIGKNARIFLIANSGEFNDTVNTVHSMFDSSSTGSISRFGRFNPIFYTVNTSSSAGAVLNLDFGSIGIDLGYLAPRANNPSEKNGLFDGEFGALAQLVLFPKGNFNVGLTYVRYYAPGNRVNVTGSTGSSYAIRPFGNVATSSDSVGAQLNWRIAPSFLLSGWFGYTWAEAQTGTFKGANADIINYAVSLGFPDLGFKGNFLGLLAGVPPKVTSNDLDGSFQNLAAPNREDKNTSYHLEAFYRIQVSNNISITPGAFVILNPEQNDNNDTIWVGTIRTTFSF
ncbi:iron uptake porin [Phormidium sp. LEGE 05292]|uniref:iron uptake porin n=1 Tax=[Phormidium] sp. LEGE 05292 TaxID=767427 RepID=UPI001882E9EE|nr:iron uptake porin [Phormidium sp. LEGE 05292]MBE9227679.1 iron uptake porin [Phormidium sp. LEGE 05292]